MRRLRQTRLIDSMNAWVGSWSFLVIHVVWFTLWLAEPWDINLLTMIVSLEAIILMILLLMAQNRQSMRDDLRDEADLQADLQAVELLNKVVRDIHSLKKDVRDLRNKK